MWNNLKLLVQMLTASFVRDEEGQTLVEYALILALVSVVIAGVLVTLEGGIAGVFNSITGAL